MGAHRQRLFGKGGIGARRRCPRQRLPDLFLFSRGPPLHPNAPCAKRNRQDSHDFSWARRPFFLTSSISARSVPGAAGTSPTPLWERRHRGAATLPPPEVARSFFFSRGPPLHPNVPCAKRNRQDSHDLSWARRPFFF